MPRIRAIISDLIGVVLIPKRARLRDFLRGAPRLRINRRLLSFYRALSRRGLAKVYLFTRSTVHHDENLLDDLQGVFADVFDPVKLDVGKDNPASYRHIAEVIGVPPEQIVFIDDTKRNALAAAKAGLHAFHFVDTEAAMRGILGLLKR